MLNVKQLTKWPLPLRQIRFSSTIKMKYPLIIKINVHTTTGVIYETVPANYLSSDTNSTEVIPQVNVIMM